MSKDIDKPIVLIGLMGAGKTSLGQALAEKCDLTFYDADKVIEEGEGRSIVDIFVQEGEPHFRDLEKRAAIDLIQNNKQAVISLGGGAFINDDTRDYVLKNTISVFIKADLEVLLKRIGSGEGRPLLKDNPQETLKTLIEERYPIYGRADYTVDSKDEPLEQTLNRLIEAIQK